MKQKGYHRYLQAMDSYKNRDVTVGGSGSVGRDPPLLTSDSALFLDFDGTLVDLAPTPDSVFVSDDLANLLLELRDRLGGALAIVTGRRLESVDRWLPYSFQGAGLHGAQLRFDANRGAIIEKETPQALQLAERLQARFGGEPGLMIENKHGGVALHYRQAPDRKAECDAAMQDLAREFDLNVVIGHSVIEARSHGIDKGVGVTRLMQEKPFTGRKPVFAGDDTTDEDAIVVVQKLGGCGIRVGDAASAALHRLRDVAAVGNWLERSRLSLAARS